MLCQTHLRCCVLEVLDTKGVQYKVIELDTDPDGKAIRAEMADLIGRTSVPVSFIYYKTSYIFLIMPADLFCPLLSEGHLDRIHLYWWLQ
jgi:glutaredoxin